MRRDARLGIAWLAWLTLAALGCSSPDPLLIVNLRTDLSPGAEFTAISVRVAPAGERTRELFLDTTEAASGAAYVSGRRVAELSLRPGELLVEVELHDAAGALVGRRAVLVSFAASQAVTVLITRDCVGVDCGALTCHAGACVDPRCSEETPEACGPAECATVSNCPTAAACATVQCRGGACLAYDDGSRCATDEVCDPVLGCRSRDACLDEACCEIAGAPVDVLLVIDNSISMEEEQVSLAEQIPRVVDILASGDFDGDGVPETAAAYDLHFGVVTTDMGTGGVTVPTCPEPMFGDDGALRTLGRADLASCVDSYPTFLTLHPSDAEADPHAVARDLTCVGQAGTGGCGFEQPLEAMLKAVTPSTSPLRFVAGTSGHADGANAGFLRDDSILVVLVLSDENDCSVSDPELLDPGSTRYSEDLNLRCFSYPDALHPVARYVDGLLATRSDPRDLIFAVVAGIPMDLTPGGTPEFAAVLSDPRMAEVLEGIAPTRLRFSCEDVGGAAFPPRRLVEAAQQLQERGATSALGSICQADLSGPLEDLLRRISLRLGERCLI
jgi:hypothetical protein